MMSPSPHRGEGVGGLWPPSLTFRTPIRRNGYGEGARASQSEPPHPNPLPSGERGFAYASCSVLTAAIFFLFAYWSSAFADAAFQSWLQSLWPEAHALGVSRATFDLATRGLEPDLSLPDLVLPGRPERPSGGQAEFVLTPADYLKESTFDNLAGRGRKLFDQYRDTLNAIEKQFGVPPAIVLAIFGRETDYGSARDKRNAIRVLATQAYLGKRKEKFLDEFLQALKILDEGQVKLADMTSSWAGAMGLTQFMPSD
jgi:membrane-bound lytic murein transglycosylase B